jgi:hypothetical protein
MNAVKQKNAPLSKRALTSIDVAELLKNDNNILGTAEIAIWLGVSHRMVRDIYSKEPRFPKPLSYTVGRKRSSKYSAASIRKWAGLP